MVPSMRVVECASLGEDDWNDIGASHKLKDTSKGHCRMFIQDITSLKTIPTLGSCPLLSPSSFVSNSKTVI